MPVFNFVRRSYYQDSVALMSLSREMEAVPGVHRAAAMMATPPNLALLRDAGLLGPDGADAAPGDLVVAVQAETAAAAEAARAAAERALTARHALRAPGGAARPRTLAAARRALPDANLALISVPGLYAGAEAWKALRAGLHVMLFSDNVPVETEVALKRAALEHGLWLLGPDCGTALIHGVPLGFANAVPRGRIGLVGASGTGLQEVCCAIAALGEGVSHAVGVGGRDLSDAVGGLMTRAVLAALADDPATEALVVVGKPPSPEIAARLVQDARRLDKPCVLGFVGAVPGPDVRAPHIAATLEDAARAAVALVRGHAPKSVQFTRQADEIERLVVEARYGLSPTQRWVRGVFSGGTLAWEARHLLARSLPDVAEGVTGGGEGHRVTDLGEDVFTVGRPHPMLDGAVRREWIAREGGDPTTAVLLLDLVLGWGVHADPAGEILPALETARARAREAARGLAVVASVTGTDQDPQCARAQRAALAASGVVVMDSNAQAARLAALIASRRGRA